MFYAVFFVPLLFMKAPRFTYPKEEKLKSHHTINRMFTEGRTISKYPLRLVYVPLEEPGNDMIKMGVSVSKKYFKKAVDRNYYKRILREVYRHNKHILIDRLENPYAFMFFYQTKDRLSFEEVNTKAIQLFEKFASQENL
jgi:ribonuclease P protein component